ncbi:hypothetical protein CFOL_v3_11924 [Cephalotus follicularis]|uniref:Retroviral polymerase SH3-like domain-containing protein n=1 Tax=Cephalotus follicularis TaxID=3775 RepID=A0A1Q3BK92_CEPFO|nr:hypothetical protein CFOL_v3_11924 [Cephalotus follicularis]
MAQSARCVFLGYAIGQKCFRCYDPCIKRIRISRNELFLEKVFFYKKLFVSQDVSPSIFPLFTNSQDSSPLIRFKPGVVYKRREKPHNHAISPPPDILLDLVSDQLAVPTSDPISTEVPSLRRSSRISRPPHRYHDCSSLFTSLQSISVPTSYKQADGQKCWQQAMQEELNALVENDTWDKFSALLVSLLLAANGFTQ